MRCQNTENIFHPFVIISVTLTVDVGMDVCIVPMRPLSSWCMRVHHRVMVRCEGVREVCDLVIPDRQQDFIVGTEFIDADYLPTDFATCRVVDQHTVAEELATDRRAGRIDRACKSSPRRALPHEDAAFVICRHRVSAFFELIVDLIRELRLNMHLEELVGDTIPAEIVSLVYLPFYSDEFTETQAAFPAPVTIKFYHTDQRYKTEDIISVIYGFIA
jgi:hypothetical protein